MRKKSLSHRGSIPGTVRAVASDLIPGRSYLKLRSNRPPIQNISRVLFSWIIDGAGSGSGSRWRSTAEVKSQWSYTPTSLCNFMVINRDNSSVRLLFLMVGSRSTRGKEDMLTEVRSETGQEMLDVVS